MDPALAKSSESWNKECLEYYNGQKVLDATIVSKLCAGRAYNLLSFNIVNLTESPSCKRPIIFIGENHDQNSDSLKAILDIANLVPVRGIETVPWDEFSKLKRETTNTNQNDGIAKAIKRNRPISRFLTWLKGEGTALYRAYDKGFYVDSPPLINGRSMNLLNDPYDQNISSAQWALFMNNLGSKEERCNYEYLSKKNAKELESYFSSSTKFFDLFGSLIGKPGFPPVTIALETAPTERIDTTKYNCTDFNSQECMHYLQTARNQRMEKNILSIRKKLGCNIPLAVIVGSCHVGPLTKMLQKSGFSSTADQLDPEPKIKCGSDPAFPNE